MDLSPKIDRFLDKNFRNHETSIFRDLSLNFKKLLEDGALEPAERFTNLLAIATALNDKELMFFAREILADLGIAPELIQEAAEVAGIMGMNNVYYKFRHFLGSELAQADYSRAGLRMQSLMKPLSGKANFELMALAVSIINACPTCVASHEKSVRELGVSADKVHDVARLAAVCKGLSSLQVAQS